MALPCLMDLGGALCKTGVVRSASMAMPCLMDLGGALCKTGVVRSASMAMPCLMDLRDDMLPHHPSLKL